jgi:hypothetical protein
MTALHRRLVLRSLALYVCFGILLVILLGLTLWAAGALYFLLPLKEFRLPFAVIYAIVIFGLLLAIRPLWKGAIAVIGLFFLVFGWTMTIRPSNDGNWQPEVAQTAWAEIAGEKVTIHNFRNFDYRTSTDFVPHWETKVPGVTHAKEISTRMN